MYHGISWKTSAITKRKRLNPGRTGRFFSVTIDELLSGEKLLSIAENENKKNIQKMCDYLLGMLDVISFMLIWLPLYPNPVNGYIYSVNLFAYTDTTALNRSIYWTMILALVVIGTVKILLTYWKQEKAGKL